MRVIKKKLLSNGPVYDISVKDNQQYCLKNGVVCHNTGAYYGADNIWIIGRQQEKESQSGPVIGFNFVINVEKSRFVREKSKFIVTVLFDGGIHRWSGLFDFALENKYIASGKKGWYNVVDMTTGELIEPASRRSDLEKNDALWTSLLANTEFTQALENAYKLNSPMMQEEFEE